LRPRFKILDEQDGFSARLPPDFEQSPAKILGNPQNRDLSVRQMDLTGAMVANHSREACHAHDSSSLGGFRFGGLKSGADFLVQKA